MCYAQQYGVSTDYTRSTVIQSRQSTSSKAPTSGSILTGQPGVSGFEDVTVFAPKYRERLVNYTEQIQTGLEKGWLNQTQANHVDNEIDRLRRLEADVAAKQYALPGRDTLEKEMTTFNIELTNAQNGTAGKAIVTSSKPAKVQIAHKKTVTKHKTIRK